MGQAGLPSSPGGGALFLLSQHYKEQEERERKEREMEEERKRQAEARKLDPEQHAEYTRKEFLETEVAYVKKLDLIIQVSIHLPLPPYPLTTPRATNHHPYTIYTTTYSTHFHRYVHILTLHTTHYTLHAFTLTHFNHYK